MKVATRVNLYFLVEDEKSFFKVLPVWLGFLEKKYHRAGAVCELTENSYLLESGQGVTQIVTKALFASLDTILEHPGVVDEFIVIIDAENFDAEMRKNEIMNLIAKHYPDHGKWMFNVRIFVCDCCFETSHQRTCCRDYRNTG